MFKARSRFATAMVSFRNPRSRHPYHMHDMIRAQPAFLRETEGVLKDLDVRAFLGSPRSLVLTGCGTSFHAAMYGARVLQEAFGARARVEAVHAYDLLSGPPPGPRVRALAAHVAGGDRVPFLGSGLDEIPALEAALKIRDPSGLPAAGYHP